MDAEPEGPAPDLRYPAEWEADVVLADGGTVHLRPIRPDDDAALLGLYERLSDQSIYLRFFSPVSRPTAQQLERLSAVDYETRMALVAELGDELVAVARYDRDAGAPTAEVAFTVQDDQQGRGLGSILLEHLAAVARSRGVESFYASTLPDNRKMLDVFRDAGFEVERQFADGVVRVTFPIAPTDTSVAVQESREQVAEARSMARVLAPRSVAVVGAGRRPGTFGHEIFRNLLDAGFTGPVYPVNPHATAVASVRAYPSILDVPDDVDLAIITVPAPAVPAVIDDCARKRVQGLVVITAGFAETGSLADEQRIVQRARRSGMRLVGPNCMGIVNTSPNVSMNATFAPFQPVRGRLGFASQSGGLGIELLGKAAEMGLGVSTFVSMGNKADVSGNDLLQFWDTDPDTDVILLYLESFGNPRKFVRLARRIARTKPILAVKSGRTAAGSRAASSHTAALASADVAVDALFRQAGVTRVDTLEQLFDTAQVLARQPVPPGRRIAIITNGGGPGILAADACEGARLTVPELSAATQGELRSFLSPDASTRNPVDLVASATAATYERAVRVALADTEIDCVLVIFVPPLVTAAEDVAQAIVSAARTSDGKPVVACFLTRDRPPDALRSIDMGQRAIPCFTFPESAAVALGRAADYADWLRRAPGRVPALEVDVDAARELVRRVLADRGTAWLDADEAGELARCFGLQLVEQRRAASADEAVAAAAEVGYPVALKAGAAELVHKSDIGGVCLDLADAAAVRDAFAAMYDTLGDRMGDAVIQPMVPSGVETIVGVTQDPSFGPLVLFGMGGVTAELVRDTSLRLVPLTDVDAHELIRSLRSSPLLFGYRGTPTTDHAALEDFLLRVGVLADALPEVRELDCNPVVVSPDGAIAVDLKVRVEEVAPGPPLGVRRLRAPA